MVTPLRFSDRRLWVLGYRCHHGAIGLVLAVAGLLTPNPLGPILFGGGVTLMVDDEPDFPWTPVRA